MLQTFSVVCVCCKFQSAVGDIVVNVVGFNGMLVVVVLYVYVVGCSAA